MDFRDFELITDRLRLIIVSKRYREEIFKEFTDEVNVYMYPMTAKSTADTDAYIDSAQKAAGTGKSIDCVILDKITGEFYGCGGVHRVDGKYPELGIWTKMSAHGRRIGREAMTFLAVYVANHFDVHGLMYPADYRNLPSRLIAESMGGILVKRYDAKQLNGGTLHLVEYFIDVNNLLEKE